MKAPITQEEIDYRADLTNKITAISSIQGLFTDIEDKTRRLRILKTLLAALNYGDALNIEIDAEIKAIEEAKADAETEDATDEDTTQSSEVPETSGESVETNVEDINLGTLDALESFDSSSGDILLEEQEFNELADTILLTEDDLPAPSALDAEKDFSENN